MRTIRAVAIIVVGGLTGTIGVLVTLALWEYLSIIGRVFVALVIVIAGCLIWVCLVGAYVLVGILLARKRREDLHSKLIIADGVVAWPKSDGSFVHLSAQLEEARQQKQLPAPSVTVEPVDKDGLTPSQLKDIKDLFDEGCTNPIIADSLGIPKWKVQKITAPWRLTPKTASSKSD